VSAHRFLLFDRDSKFGTDVFSAVRGLGSHPTRTVFRSPWQNGMAERWVGSCRRDLLDHVIVLNEQHLKRLLSEYVRYYHEDRTHLGLAKDTPTGRPAMIRCRAEGRIQSFPRLGGLHHRYPVAAWPPTIHQPGATERLSLSQSEPRGRAFVRG
jgi:putative transposase